jgi:DNA-binding SARP family transcriptional activator
LQGKIVRYMNTLKRVMATRLHRDRVVDVLWPEVDLDAALPRLHKAAHFARQALRSRKGVVLKDEIVSLFPDVALDVDVRVSEAAADAALKPRTGSVEACAAAGFSVAAT